MLFIGLFPEYFLLFSQILPLLYSELSSMVSAGSCALCKGAYMMDQQKS